MRWLRTLWLRLTERRGAPKPNLGPLNPAYLRAARRHRDRLYRAYEQAANDPEFMRDFGK